MDPATRTSIISHSYDSNKKADWDMTPERNCIIFHRHDKPKQIMKLVNKADISALIKMKARLEGDISVYEEWLKETKDKLKYVKIHRDVFDSGEQIIEIVTKNVLVIQGLSEALSSDKTYVELLNTYIKKYQSDLSKQEETTQNSKKNTTKSSRTKQKK